MKKALITGVTGQDGAYLAKFLVSKGYKVFGGFRRSSTRNFWRLHYLDAKKDVKLIPLDLLDQSSLMHAIRIAEPDEIYNLAAQSFVDVSFNESISTGEVSGLGVARLLESVRMINPKIRVYQASTSEMFGNAPHPQSEATPFQPASPYAVAKLYAHSMGRIFREGYGIFVACGILFNHESPIRGIEFVTKKITDAVARIKMGYIDELILGNLEAKRDWGFAGEYVEAMWRMLQQKRADDFVIATGESHSVRELCEEAFSVAGLDYKKYVKVSREFYRPLDVNYLLGDPSKAERELKWKAKTHFKDLVRMMVLSDLAKYKDPMSHSSQFLKHV